MVSGAVGDPARDGVLSSETPDGEILVQHQQDALAQDPSYVGGLEAAAQEAGTPYNGVDVREGANCSAEGGFIGGVLSPETPDVETQHHQQEVIANDPSHTSGLETAQQQEAGLSRSKADAEEENCADERGSVAGVFLALETSDERTQHHQHGVIAHDASHAGDLEAAQEAGTSDKGDVEGASGHATAQQADTPDMGDVESANGSSAAAQEAGALSNTGSVEGANAPAESGLEALGMVAKSTAGALLGEDGVRENVAEKRQLEDSDELYDIDDLEMSSSEDN